MRLPARLAAGAEEGGEGGKITVSAVDLRLNTKLRTEGGGQTHDGNDEQNGAFFAFLH